MKYNATYSNKPKLPTYFRYLLLMRANIDKPSINETNDLSQDY